jgi:hydrogenase expression/formation protein HypD
MCLGIPGQVVKSITELAGDGEYTFMEVCGGHSHTIYRRGLERLLPPFHRAGARAGLSGLRDSDGPRRRRDLAGGEADVICTTFGDTMRAHRETAALVGQQRAAAHG